MEKQLKFITLIAGSNWNNSSSCSSRCQNGNNTRSNVNTNISGRRSIRSYLQLNFGYKFQFGGMPEKNPEGRVIEVQYFGNSHPLIFL